MDAAFFEDVTTGTRHYGVDAAVAAGLLAAVPDEVEIEHAAFGVHAAVALVPLRLGASAGRVRALQPGDLLSTDEVAHAGTAFDTLVSRHQVARLPLDRGVVALALLAVR